MSEYLLEQALHTRTWFRSTKTQSLIWKRFQPSASQLGLIDTMVNPIRYIPASGAELQQLNESNGDYPAKWRAYEHNQ